MAKSPDSSLRKHLGCIEDPRHHNTRHLLPDMLLIALCGAISGAESWTQVAEYGRSKLTWFKQFLQLPNGIPSHDTFETIDGEHGRFESRRYYNTDAIDWLQGNHAWAGIKNICMAVRERDVNGKTSTERANFISSLKNQATAIAKAIREHWGIENSLHWCLDVSFREGHCRVRKDHAPENFGILRHMAMNLLKRKKSLKGGIQTKRLKAA